jgi:hypothetical protein
MGLKRSTLMAVEEKLHVPWDMNFNTRLDEDIVVKRIYATDVITEIMQYFVEVDISSVSISYYGSGDSGSIDSMDVTLKDGSSIFLSNYDHASSDFKDSCPDLADIISKAPTHAGLFGRHVISDTGDYEWKLRKVNPFEFLTDYSEEFLIPSGYELNDGGQGTIEFCMESMRVISNHGTNYLHTENEENIIDI